MSGRTLVIGDIHGSARALKQALDRANVSSSDTIIQLGDVADGWSETSECVDILLGLNLIALRGNHDVWVYDWINHGHRPHLWTSQGGEATIKSYVEAGALMDRKHQDFWNNQKDWYIDDQNRLFIHAGWAYLAKKEHWNVSSITQRQLFELQAGLPVTSYGRINQLGTIAKECHWDRDILFGARSGSIRSKVDNKPTGFKTLEQFKEVYIGHTATKDHLPHNHLNLWNLDSGSGWYGKLTIMDVDTKEYWQSDFSKDLYPDEKGR